MTVGTVRVGTKENVIADTAELGINIRGYTPQVRLARLERRPRA